MVSLFKAIHLWIVGRGGVLPIYPDRKLTNPLHPLPYLHPNPPRSGENRKEGGRWTGVSFSSLRQECGRLWSWQIDAVDDVTLRAGRPVGEESDENERQDLMRREEVRVRK